MVCSTVTDSEKEIPTEGPCCTVGIAPGDYRLVGWDMDTTGKKVIDEICQIATYTPDSTYSQYVMPYKDLNPTAIKRHSMKIVTNGKFRVLRHSKTNEVRCTVAISSIEEKRIYIVERAGSLEWSFMNRETRSDGTLMVPNFGLISFNLLFFLIATLLCSIERKEDQVNQLIMFILLKKIIL